MSAKNQEDINKKIFSRNKASRDLDPVISFRGQHTKYNQFPIYDKTKPIEAICNEFSFSNTFTPGTSAPFYGYATNVDHESQLHNRFMPYQPSAPQGQFIPSSSSDMYKADKSLSSFELPQVPESSTKDLLKDKKEMNISTRIEMIKYTNTV